MARKYLHDAALAVVTIFSFILILATMAYAENVRIRITYVKPEVEPPLGSVALPYVCRRTCEVPSMGWMDELDRYGQRVIFTMEDAVEMGDGEWSDGCGIPDPQGEFETVCFGHYEAFWVPGNTWSWVLTTRAPDGRESGYSNVLTKTHEVPPTTSTTVTSTTTLRPTTSSSPPTTLPPLGPPGLIELRITPESR
jgi:hypothetical protein